MISPLNQTLQLTKVGWVEIQTTRVGHSVLVLLLFLSSCQAEKHSASVIFQFHPQYRCFLNSGNDYDVEEVLKDSLPYRIDDAGCAIPVHFTQKKGILVYFTLN